jgi:hypothetical protein
VARPDEVSITIDENLQKMYRSGVSMLFYSIKYERPDLSISVRELSKCMDKVMFGTY